MSLVYLAGTNPWLPLFTGFDEEDSTESAGEVTEQLDFTATHIQGRSETGLKRRLNLFQISLCSLISINEQSQAELHHYDARPVFQFSMSQQLFFIALNNER